jgi:hypothetical protein
MENHLRDFGYGETFGLNCFRACVLTLMNLQQTAHTLRVCDVIDLGVDSKGCGAEKGHAPEYADDAEGGSGVGCCV